jgi:hypothetical protein
MALLRHGDNTRHRLRQTGIDLAKRHEDLDAATAGSSHTRRECGAHPDVILPAAHHAAMTGYSAAKAGVIALTKARGKELA